MQLPDSNRGDKQPGAAPQNVSTGDDYEKRRLGSSGWRRLNYCAIGSRSYPPIRIFLVSTQRDLTMKTAHYYASRSQKFLVIGVDGRLTEEKYEVGGKAEARKLASELSAKPWNF